MAHRPRAQGAGGATGDIGTHAFNLACSSPACGSSARRRSDQSFVPGRRVDDNGHVLLRFEGGARGMLWCSQVAPGNENALRLRVYGEKAGSTGRRRSRTASGSRRSASRSG
jgi:predicted dehydrogenase